jgi:hypothetical protein
MINPIHVNDDLFVPEVDIEESVRFSRTFDSMHER